MSASDAALIVFMLLVTWSFYRAQRDENIAFNLLDLVMENGRVSKLAFAFMTGLVCLTWIMIKLTQAGKMTEGYVGLYGAIIIAPVIAKLFSTPPPAGTTTTIDSKTTTQTIAGIKQGD